MSLFCQHATIAITPPYRVVSDQCARQVVNMRVTEASKAVLFPPVKQKYLRRAFVTVFELYLI